MKLHRCIKIYLNILLYIVYDQRGQLPFNFDIFRNIIIILNLKYVLLLDCGEIFVINILITFEN